MSGFNLVIGKAKSDRKKERRKGRGERWDRKEKLYIQTMEQRGQEMGDIQGKKGKRK